MIVVNTIITKPNKTSKNATKVMLAVNTIADINHVAFERDIFLSSTKYDTGTSVDEMVDVSAAMDINAKNEIPTYKPTVPIESNKVGKI